jgi:hypothetical protein
MKLGLVKNPSPVQAPPHGFEDEWEDITENDDNKNDTKQQYVFDGKRRSSIDLDNMSTNFHDSWETTTTSGMIGYTYTEYDPNKRHRSKKPMVASITEENNHAADEEEIATVDGDSMEDVDGAEKTLTN